MRAPGVPALDDQAASLTAAPVAIARQQSLLAAPLTAALVSNMRQNWGLLLTAAPVLLSGRFIATVVLLTATVL